MPLSLTCPACAARLKAPDNAAGRTLRCPKCKGPIVVPVAGRAADLTFDTSKSSAGYADDEGNPFDDEGPADVPTEADPTDRPKGRRAAAKKKPTAGYNPFDADTASGEPEPGPPQKRRYRKDGDFNPFGDVPEADEPDPVGDGFEFGLEAPPPPPTSEFDFGPQDPRRDDG